MLLTLRLSNVLKATFSGVEFDPAFDDARSVIASICEEIENAGIADFRVSGFGDDSWPVDISTDLTTLIEQLPAALVVLDQREGEFRLDFYEQGIQRLIFGQCAGDVTKLRCQSLTNWEPNPSTEQVQTGDFSSMLGAMYCQFLNVALAVPMSDTARKALTAWGLPHRVAA